MRVDSVRSGAVWALGGRIATAVAGVATGALLARLLSPPDLGRYLVLVSIATTSAAAALFGINQAVVRLVASARAKGDLHAAGEFTTTSALLGLAGAISGGALIALFLNDLLGAVNAPPASLLVRVLTGAWIVLLAVQNLAAECIRAYRQISTAVLVGGAVQATVTTTILAMCWTLGIPFSLSDTVFVVLAATALGGLYGFLTLRPVLLRSPGPSITAARCTLRIAAPVWITTILLTVLVQADIWIVAGTAGEAAVAIYGAAARLVAAVALPLIVANAVIPPFVSELFAREQRAELEALVRSVATLTSIPAGLVLLFFILFGRTVLERVYGLPYVGGATVLAWLSLGQIVNVLAGSCGLVLMLTGYERVMLAITALATAAGVIGALYLNQIFGTSGVAAAMAAAMIGQNVLMVVAVRHRLGIWTFVRYPGSRALRQVAPLFRSTFQRGE